MTPECNCECTTHGEHNVAEMIKHCARHSEANVAALEERHAQALKLSELSQANEVRWMHKHSEQAKRIAELESDNAALLRIIKEYEAAGDRQDSEIGAKDTELERLRAEAIIRITDLFNRHERPTYASKSGADSDLALILTSFEAEEALKPLPTPETI